MTFEGDHAVAIVGLGNGFKKGDRSRDLVGSKESEDTNLRSRKRMRARELELKRRSVAQGKVFPKPNHGHT